MNSRPYELIAYFVFTFFLFGETQFKKTIKTLLNLLCIKNKIILVFSLRLYLYENPECLNSTVCYLAGCDNSRLTKYLTLIVFNYAIIFLELSTNLSELYLKIFNLIPKNRLPKFQVLLFNFSKKQLVKNIFDMFDKWTSTLLYHLIAIISHFYNFVIG